ncbi:ATP-binding protein [Neolewinella antarctica]|uniref:AAA+ ATPase domain-containing protein n=1 Tax=Neolewinella antarctica TaxID=442734 RepID=A0ABX0XE93_9BACT|nr:AAA family ATPase [Neolewinella antarctica]NJC27641.1 hypothetical protein [Neolewinella antarctica]
MESAFLKFAARHRALLAATPRSFTRSLAAEVNWNSKLIAILGPRGVGKTTLLAQRLIQLALPPSEALYLDLGDLLFQEYSLVDFAEWYKERGGKYLFLDEVHRYPGENWAAAVKLLYDFHRANLSVVISGSSILQLLDAGADLSRRIHYYHLPGLSFREYLVLKHGFNLEPLDFTDLLRAPQAAMEPYLKDGFTPLPYFEQYLKNGYYGFVLEDEYGYYDQVNQTIQLVLSQDIGSVGALRTADANKLGRLLQAVASSVPFKPNISKIAQRIGIDRNTLIEYLNLLERANVIHQLRADGKGITPLSKPDKIYLDNPNLIYALSPQRAEVGAIRETFFYNQLSYLVRRKLAFPPEIRLPKKGDFIYRYQGEAYVFEIGGPNKTADQIGTGPGCFTVVDAAATAAGHRIPLWLFGFFY